MLTADLRRDYVRTHFVRFDDAEPEALDALYRELEAQGERDVRASAGADVELVCQRSADIRYVGQEHAVTVELGGPLDSAAALAEWKSVFDQVHAQRFGHHAPDEPAELVSLRVSVIGQREPVRFAALNDGSARGGAEGFVVERRPAALGELPELAPVDAADRALVGPGASVKGPALVEEAGSCLCLPPGAIATCDESGNLIVEL
jgi:N-methylhydantoinase A